MKYGNIFWGVILITLGVLFAMRNLDIFFFSWGSILRLWPLVFVFWGIAILPVKSMVKLLLTVVTVAVAVLILASNPGDRHYWDFWLHDRYNYEKEYDRDEDRDRHEDYSSYKKHIYEDYTRNIEYATLNIDAAAGDFDLSGITSRLFEFETEGNAGPYNVVTSDVEDDKVIIEFTQKRFRGKKNLKNTVELKLNDNPVWKFNIDVGAANFEMDLSPFKVKDIDIDQGASAIELKLGEKYPKTHVNIDAGVSGIEIKVPKESACEVRTQTILSGKDFDGFVKLRKGLFQTPNFSDSANQIIIEIDAAVSGITVDRY